MKKTYRISLAGLICLAGFVANPAQAEQIAAADVLRLEADVRFLAHDMLEGREAGTRGYDVAAHYVAETFRGIGLDPGGDDGSYYQQVPLREYRKDADGVGKLTLTRDGKEIELVENEDYVIFSSSRETRTDLEVDAVFAGFGIVSEDHGRNDYEGLDVEGKAVFLLGGAPKFLNSEERAHLSSTKSQTASALGAVAAIGIFTQTLEKVIPFATAVEIWTRQRSMNWLDEEGQPFTLAPNIQAGAVLSMDGAARFITSDENSWEEILAAAETDEGVVAGFELDVTARFEVDSIHRELVSPNVVGILPGTDPVLSKEYVVLTAHLDHEGIRPTDEPGDDEIYNGAMDNAVGTAAMIEVARLLSLDPPRRSVIFIALAAEEKGLRGSDYYARNPTVPKGSMVAVVNLDMPIMTYDFTDVVAFGAERSTLYPVVEAAVHAHGLDFSPDPVPDEGLFTRSDHYSFVKQGIPAVFLSPGHANGGGELQAEFRKTHYHQVSDEVELVDFDALAKFTDTKHSIATGIANMPERPVWKKGDFFGTTFNGRMEE